MSVVVQAVPLPISLKITAALAKVVGHALEPPELWENLLETGGLTNLRKNTFPVDMRSESRSDGLLQPE